MRKQPSTIEEPARALPVIHTTDVLVIGSGPAGLAAAIARLARESASLCWKDMAVLAATLLRWVLKVLPGIDTSRPSIAKGLALNLRNAPSSGASVAEPQSQSHAIDGEAFKAVADDLVLEAGITPMLHRMFVAPIMDGNRITGAIVESKAGREASSRSVLLTRPAMRMLPTGPEHPLSSKPSRT